jgi:hypothetical protein
MNMVPLTCSCSLPVYCSLALKHYNKRGQTIHFQSTPDIMRFLALATLLVALATAAPTNEVEDLVCQTPLILPFFSLPGILHKTSC